MQQIIAIMYERKIGRLLVESADYTSFSAMAREEAQHTSGTGLSQDIN